MNAVGWVGLALGGTCVVVYGIGMVVTRRNIARWKRGDLGTPTDSPASPSAPPARSEEPR